MPEAQTEIAGTQRRIGPRALIVGALCVLGICVVVAYGELVVSRGGSINAILLGATHIPAGALAGLLALLLLTAVLRRLSARLALGPHELAVIYSMMSLAALISSFGLMTQLLPNLAGTNYFANAANRWADILYPHLPEWLVPYDPRGGPAQDVAKGFYEGLLPGQHIPWRLWVRPLAFWSVVALLMFTMMACLMAVFRRQWVDHEKLSFPLVQLPLEMIGGGADPQAPGGAARPAPGRFFRLPWMWAGFALPFLVHAVNGLHGIFPVVPEIRIIWVLNQYASAKPWTDIMFTPVIVAFSVIGISFLLPQEVCFSIWAFLLLSRVQDYVASVTGARMDVMPLYGGTRFFVGYQSLGASIVISVAFFWVARRHLRDVWRAVWRRNQDERSELVGARAAALGVLGCFALILAWCSLAGLNVLLAAVIFVSFIFFSAMVLARCVSEVGLLMLQPVFTPRHVLALVVPEYALGARNLTLLSVLDGVFFRDPRNVMPAFMDGMKLAAGVRLRLRDLAAPFALAVCLAMAAGYVIQLRTIYHYGGVRLNSWFFLANPTLYFQRSVAVLSAREPLDVRAPAWAAVGAAVTVGLYALRARFVWWPVHPIGYAIGAAWPGIVYWSSFFMGWLAKLLLVRYGGMRMFRRARPFFLGLILGEFSAAIVWVIVSACLDVPGPFIPLT